jgi:uncharacterized protein YcbX
MTTENRKRAGTLHAAYRYPVKSMRGESLPEAPIGWSGIEGDRRYGFVKSESLAGFPWLTGREVPEMVLYAPRLTDPTDPITSDVIVTLPDGRDLPVSSVELRDSLTNAYGHPAHLMHLKRGCYDAMPISVISTATIDVLGAEAGLELNARRFRPNLLVDLAEPIGFDEERWIGSLIQIGDHADAPQIRLARKNVRCAMTNIDPDNSERDARVLKTIVQMRDECAGIYGSVQRIGRACAGDPIYLIEE